MTTHANRLISDDDDELPQAPQPAPSAPLTPTSRQADPTPRRVGSKGGAYPGRRQMNSYVPENLFLWFKVISAQTRKPMVELMEEALSEYRDRYAAQQKFGGM